MAFEEFGDQQYAMARYSEMPTHLDEEGIGRQVQKHDDAVLAGNHQLDRARQPRLQEPPAAAGAHQEGDEDRRGGQDDLCGGAHPVCQGLRHLHHGADDAGVDPRRGAQAQNAAEVRHRGRAAEERHVRLSDRHRAPRGGEAAQEALAAPREPAEPDRPGLPDALPAAVHAAGVLADADAEGRQLRVLASGAPVT
ncbi:hypothetical protein KL930_002930 [Ogataea haglerorum]|uniref:Uncharacterized protein n=1 Tax=Ogataea haglerorum TaxID=1937702 RepID=A0AAN6D7X9_9ASCO|nr:uncharacterized protein KL911_002813 [Ogataea haglerorum]KAG7694106.1 hypothetical protein KL915_003777 [Ogataea haglerorum]KAG7694807.1 hypothetical protein KL951_003984 [Ogataea haglerorum]KAG7704630.1 hypothetical protein KL914_004021 [Ogataea haglerorum]KAG7704929.1 hypothetical protein KL950_004102 [Ogataea haglerorum]KAG7719085.1 hypothetical protein KL913_002083 [Ogataea haglerorum]